MKPDGCLAPRYREIKNKTALRIAASFRRGLRSAIGAAKLAEADALNNAETDLRVCNTHEFCDPNEYMWRAFRRVMGRDMDIQSGTDCCLSMDAWEAFKAEGRRAAK